MKEKNLRLVSNEPTRRQVIVVGAIAFAGLAVGSARAQTKQATAESQSTAPEKRTFLHQEVEFSASPQRIYEILLDSKQFGAFSGYAAEISPEAGGTFSMFGGRKQQDHGADDRHNPATSFFLKRSAFFSFVRGRRQKEEMNL